MILRKRAAFRLGVDPEFGIKMYLELVEWNFPVLVALRSSQIRPQPAYQGTSRSREIESFQSTGIGGDRLGGERLRTVPSQVVVEGEPIDRLATGEGSEFELGGVGSEDF